MRQLLLICALVFSCLVSQAQVNANWTVSYTPTSVCAGDTVCFSLVPNNNPGPGPWMQAYCTIQIPGMNVFTIMPTNGYCVVIPNTGIFNVTAILYQSPNFDTIHFPLVVGQVCPGIDIISGTVYNDINGNGARDTMEPVQPGRLVQLNPGGFTASTNQSGQYSFSVNAGSYTVSILPPLYYTVTEPVPNSYSITTTGSSSQNSGNDFGIHQVPGINDLEVYFYGGPPVPGMNRNYYVNYRNVGTSTLSGSVDFVHDALMTYISSGTSPATYNAGTRTVSWNFTNLAPGQTLYQNVLLNCPVNATLGTSVTHYAIINPIPGDTAPANNRDTLERIVVSSYDPNDKIAFHDENITDTLIANGTRLAYRIRFQNTGTFYATDVILRDTLDEDLDLTTLTIEGSSHPMTWQLDQERILTFSFMGIMLPDSGLDEPGSHGHVLYSVNPKSGLSDGTQILNEAAIYFDFNAPVITNTQVNEIEIPVISVDPDQAGNVKVYPHPVKNAATIVCENFPGMKTFILVDLQGKIVRQTDMGSGENLLFEREDLKSGLYIWKINGENGKVIAGKMLLY